MLIRKIILPIFLCILAGCASTDNQMDTPTRVLVINGEGYNSVYENSPQASGFIFAVGQKFSEHVVTELVKAGANPQIYTKRDATKSTKSVVTDLLSRREQDGLIQISVRHIKNEQENYISLIANYLVLMPTLNGAGENVVSFEPGLEKQFNILDQQTQQFNPMPVNEMAEEFVQMLKNDKLI